MRLLALAFVTFVSLQTGSNARAQSDSLTLSDTIHNRTARNLLATSRQYRYHYASALAGGQLLPLLQRSADSTVRHFVRRNRLLRGFGIGMSAVGLGLQVAGLTTPRQRGDRSTTFILTGISLFYGSLAPIGQADRAIERAVQAHNGALRRRTDARTDEYYVPLFGETVLSLADTVAVVRRGLGRRYVYRGVSVAPAGQLLPLSERLADRDVNMGFTYTRRVGRIGGFFIGYGASYLATTLLLYGVLRSNGYQARLTNSPVFWSAVGAVALGYAIRFHAGRVQLGAVQLLNERLRSRLTQPEPFANP